MKKLCCVLFIVSCLTGLMYAEDSAGSLPEPEKKEMQMGELKAQLLDLDGKVVETIINCAMSFEQVEEGKYRALCAYYGGSEGLITPEPVLVPEEGKEFFQTLAKRGIDGGGNKVVYLLVHSKNPPKVGRYRPSLEAVGTRYSKSKGEYSW